MYHCEAACRKHFHFSIMRLVQHEEKVRITTYYFFISYTYTVDVYKVIQLRFNTKTDVNAYLNFKNLYPLG